MNEDSKLTDSTMVERTARERVLSLSRRDVVGDVSLRRIFMPKETYGDPGDGASSPLEDEFRAGSGSNACSTVQDSEVSSNVRYNSAFSGALTPQESSPYQSDVSSSDVSGEMDRLSLAATLGALAEAQDRIAGATRRTDRDPNLPRILPSPLKDILETDTSLQLTVDALVVDLESNDAEAQKRAVAELRLLAKYNMENRIIVANSGAIKPLVALLNSVDPDIQENAVTALLNLSINDNNKTEIAAAGAIDCLVSVLKVGNDQAKENAAATLFSLSVMDDNKVTIGTSGAIPPLVHLLINGTPRGKKDSAKALFNLSILHENKARIVRAGAIKPLVELMADPAAGMVDKAVAVLANLSTVLEGRVAIGESGGIPALVEVVEAGSQRGKENAAAALLQLCTNSHKHRALILQEGAVPPLVALSKSGTTRGKEKASAVLRHFREQQGPSLRPRPDRYTRQY